MQSIYARVQKKLNFGQNFGWQPKFVKGFRFLLDRNQKGKNWFRFPLKGKGISAKRKVSAKNFDFLCSLPLTPPETTVVYLYELLFTNVKKNT